MLLRDQPLGLGAGLLRVVLVVGEDDADVVAVQCGSPPPLPSSIGIGAWSVLMMSLITPIAACASAPICAALPVSG